MRKLAKKDELLKYIRSRGAVSTGELCEWKHENRYDRAQKTCRENKDLVRCRPMTEAEKRQYRPSNQAAFMYEWIGE